MSNLRRVSLVCAIALTIVLVWASVVPFAGEVFGAKHHRSAHLVSFAILALAWRVALPHMPSWAVALIVVGFGFLHEAIEVIGHAHPYELSDALIDGIGAIMGVTVAQIAMKLPMVERKAFPDARSGNAASDDCAEKQNAE